MNEEAAYEAFEHFVLDHIGLNGQEQNVLMEAIIMEKFMKIMSKESVDEKRAICPQRGIR